MGWRVSRERARFLAQKTMMINASLLTWITVHGNMCLGLRHPQNRGPSRAYAVAFVRQLGQELVKAGAITEQELKEAEKLEAEEGSEGFAA